MKKDKVNSIRNINSYFRKQTFSPQKNKIASSIKPLKYDIPKDINIKSIYYNMLLSLKNENYLNYYKPLNDKEKNIRTSFLKIMNQFIISNKIHYRISLLSIYIFDILINKNNNDLSIKELGLGALILVTKFYYEKEHLIRNNNFQNFMSKEYPNKDLSLLEIKCLQILNYKLNYIHPINFIDLFFLNGIIFTTDNLNKEDSIKIYYLVIKLLEFFMAINNEYTKFHPFIFACAIISLSRERNNLEIWPENLENIFHITFEDFEEAFIILKDLYKDKKNNEDLIKIKSPSNKNQNQNEIKLSIEKYITINSEENVKNNEKEKEKIIYNSPKKLNIEVIHSPFFQTPVKGNKLNTHNKNNFHSNRNNNNYNYQINTYSNHKKKLFLHSNHLDEKKKNENEEKIKNLKKKINNINIGGIFRKKITNNYHTNGNEIKTYKKKTEPISRNLNHINLNTFNSDGKKYISHEINPSIQTIYSPNYNLNYNNNNIDKSRNNPSLENYKRFHITMNNQIPSDLLEKRVKNLSMIVNHLLSNHNNNIL